MIALEMIPNPQSWHPILTRCTAFANTSLSLYLRPLGMRRRWQDETDGAKPSARTVNGKGAITSQQEATHQATH